ncbi:MAG: DUF4440 domain-containing protein [Phycisphaerae bacterium]
MLHPIGVRSDRLWWAGLAAVMQFTGCAAISSHATAVRALLAAQTDAWNRGDIPGFMQYYVRGDELTFSSGGRTERGWDATLARYQRRYPTRERMGVLRFDELEVRPLASDAALVLGRWHLTRPPDDAGGTFSLVVVRRAGNWLILHDHTSVEPPASPTESAGS